MKTEPMSQQRTARKKMRGEKGYALFMEQGTGKTWCLLADAEEMYNAGLIDAMFVLTLKGVHTNWVRREIPTHLEVAHIARAWPSGSKTVKNMRKVEQIFAARGYGMPAPLRILTMNFEALLTKDGFAFAQKFLQLTRAVFILDESERIKNPTSKTTKAVMELRKLAAYARIATGTPMDVPVDIFQQMQFLEEGCLGTNSYRAFVAEFAHLEDMNSRQMQGLIKKNPRMVHAQIVKTDYNGCKMWRNLDKLRDMVLKKAFRVRKEDCLDLPPKVYKNHYFTLEPAQRKVYDLMATQARIELQEGEQTAVHRLSVYTKLQQITSGYVIVPSQRVGMPATLQYLGENARLTALMELLTTLQGSTIIWARFREEIEAITRELKKANLTYCEYHGDIKAAEREKAIDGFQSGAFQVFVANAAAGGAGITLTRAQNVIYFSNTFRYRERAQSEDRPHRIGQTKTVFYIDLVAEETIDEPIAAALQRKGQNAGLVLGDRVDVTGDDLLDKFIFDSLISDKDQSAYANAYEKMLRPADSIAV